MKILSRDFSAKVGRENSFKPTIWNDSLHEISNSNGARVVLLNFVTSKNLQRVQCFHVTMFINILGLLLMEKHTIIDHILIDKRQHSNTIDVQT
jgi:hypothetical protein